MAKPSVKYFQDALYGQIAVGSPLLLKLIDSRPLQRLRHIRQLGVSYLTFLGAEHSRFSHSLGAMTLMGRALDHLREEAGLELKARERELAQAAALLHDVGHCAFSHTLEGALVGHHERMGARILRQDPGLRAALGSRAEPLARLLEGRLGGPSGALLHDLLSSQLDVDRLDYLVRDAHYTGVNSGAVDLGRIIASFSVHRGRLAVLERGLPAVEEYFLARHFMYRKVYFHKTSRALELLLKAAVERARALSRAGRLPSEGLTPALRALLQRGDEAEPALYLEHDDSDVLVALKAWAVGPDSGLRELAGRFLGRRKFRLLHEADGPRQDLSPARRRGLRQLLERRHPGLGEAFLVEDRLGASPYDRRHPVMVVGRGGARELSRCSALVRQIARPSLHARYYLPAEDWDAARAWLGKD